MTAAATVKVPYATASPEELRAAILPEDQPAFDQQYRQALTAAADTLRLDALEAFLAHWRRIAWSATAQGHDHWRSVLATADRILRTGELPAGSKSADEIRQLLRARRAQA